MSSVDQFRKTEKDELITRFPVALKQPPSLSIDEQYSATWMKVIVEETNQEVEIDLDNAATLRDQQKVQWINVLYKILSLGDNTLWRILVLILIVVNFIQVTYSSIFLRNTTNKNIYYSMMVCDLIYITDYIIAVTIYFWRNLQLRLNNPPRNRKTLIVDAVLVVPYPHLYQIFYKNDYSATFIALRCSSALRLFHLLRFFQEKSKSAGTNHWKYFILQYFIYFFHLQHTVACIWYLMACPLNCVRPSGWSNGIIGTYKYPKTPFEWYIICMYFALINITTAGLGDIVPSDTGERVVAAFTMTFGFILTTGVFIGTLSSQFVNSSLRMALMRSQIADIKTHCKMIGLSNKRIKQVMDYYHILWVKKKGVREAKDLKLLPKPLLMEICFDVNFCLLQCSLIFRNKPESFLRAVAVKMKHKFHQAGEIIYHQHVIKYKMVCVAAGVIEILSDEDNQSPIISFAPGSCIGEAALILSIPARATMRAASYTEVQVLYKKDFLEIVDRFPEHFAEIRTTILERINDAKQHSNTSEDNKNVTNLSLYVSQSRQLSEIKKLKDRLNPKTAYTFDSTDTFYRKCLPLYRFSENIKKLIRKPLCLSETFPWILQPETTVTWSWEIIIVINTLLIGVLYPFYIAFHRKFPPWLDALSVLLEINNLIDVYVILTTAIIEKDRTIQKFKGILFKRLNTVGFYLDVFAAFYIEVFSYVIQDSNHWFYILKLNRMLKMYRIVKFFCHLEQSVTSHLIAIRLIKYPMYLILCPYWFGAVLYIETCLQEVCDDTGWFHVKLVEELTERIAHPCTRNVVFISVYYAMTFLSGLGYGDIPPSNQTDVILVSCGIIIGILIFGYCIAEMSATFTHNLKKKIEFQESLYALTNFMNDKHLNHQIKQRVHTFFVLQWYYNEGIGITSKQSLFYNATWKIQQDVLVKERMETITSIPLFCDADDNFLQLIAIESRIIVLPPNAMITYAGDLSREMYIIQKGYCEQQTGNDNFHVIGPPGHFGLEGLLYQIQTLITVRTVTHVKLICIQWEAFTRAISMFPLIAQEVKASCEDGEVLQKLRDLTNITTVRVNTKNDIKKKKKIFKHLQGSFVNVYKYSKENNEDYGKPFTTNFGNCFWAKYLLLPICILPGGNLLKVWIVIRLLTCSAVCLLMPYQFIQAPYVPFLDNVLFGLDFIAYADLYIMMLVGYYGEEKQLIIHPCKTAFHYWKGSFFLDLVLCFPWEILVHVIKPDHDDGHSAFSHSVTSHIYHCLFRSLRVFQVYRLPLAFHYLESDINKKGDILQVFKFVPFTLMFINLWACIVIVTSCKYYHINDIREFIKNGSAQPPGMGEKVVYEYTMFCTKDSWIDRSQYNRYRRPDSVYITAIYWCSSTLMGPGFGDITPQDNVHVIINMHMIIFGVLFFGYVYASISSHKAGIHSTLSRYQEMLKELNIFMEYEEVHSAMQKKIIEYNEYLWTRTGGTQPNVILANLHNGLLGDAVLSMYENTLRAVPLFEHVERSFFRVLGKELRERYFLRGQTVIRANDLIANVFIIYRGKVEVISSYNEMQTFMGAGGLFGNIAAKNKSKSSVTITAVRNMDALFLTSETFNFILKRYPSIMKKIEKIIHETNFEYYIQPTIIISDTDSEKGSQSKHNKGADETSGNNTVEIVSSKSDIATVGGTITISSGGLGAAESLIAFFLPYKWCRIAILPDALIFTVFSYISVIAAYVNSLIVMYEFAFQHHTAQLLIIIVLLDIIFLLKIFLEIHKAYVNQYGEYITDNRKIRHMYFKNKKVRILDFVTNVPFYYCAFLLPLFAKIDTYLMFSSLRLVTLLRCYYIMEFYKVRSNKLMANTLYLKISTIIMWITIIAHLFACVWYLLACPITYCVKNSWLIRIPEYNLKDKFGIYIVCIYEVMNILTTTGSGDILPINMREAIYMILTMLVTKFFIAIFIGDVTSVLNSYTSSLVSYEYGIAELKDYLHNENVSDHQMEKMWHYVRQLWTRSRGKQIPRLVKFLPYVMKYDLMNEVYGQHLRQSYLFSGTEAAFLRQLTVLFEHVVFFPGNYIVQHGDSDQSMYFIHRGEVDILTVHPNLTETIHDVLHTGEMFGIAQGLYHGVPHHFSFRARTTVDIITLQLNKWQDLLKAFPISKDSIYQKAQDVYIKHL